MRVRFQVELGLVVGCGGTPSLVVGLLAMLYIDVVCCSLHVSQVSRWFGAFPWPMLVGGGGYVGRDAPV